MTFCGLLCYGFMSCYLDRYLVAFISLALFHVVCFFLGFPSLFYICWFAESSGQLPFCCNNTTISLIIITPCSRRDCRFYRCRQKSVPDNAAARYHNLCGRGVYGDVASRRVCSKENHRGITYPSQCFRCPHVARHSRETVFNYFINLGF